MKFWLSISPLLIVSITVKSEHLTFDQDENVLGKCIEDNLSKDSNPKVVRAAKSLTKIAVHRFLNKSHNRNQFENSLKNMCFRIKSKKTYLFDDNKVPEQLKMSMRRALITCVERKNLPRFDHEPQVLADLLDFILVDWPTPVEEMTRTHQGRSTLRLYAYATGVRLISALSHYSMNYDIFGRELRRIWMLRAEQFYDAGAKIFYIRHRFTTCSDRTYSSRLLKDIHTIDDVSSFDSRRLQDFSSRNLILRSRSSNEFCPKNDIYMEYSRYGVTSAENYLEVHKDRCNRILFFILELQSRGINSDEDDIYNGPLPNNIMPYKLEEIVWNSDDAYRSYIATLRQYFEQFPVEEPESCSSDGTIEELITRLTLTVLKKTATTSTDFLGYKEGSRKSLTRDSEKYIAPKKKFKSMFSEQNEQSDHIDESVNNYGHILYNGNSNQLRFFEDGPSMFLEILDGVSAAINFSTCS